MLMQEDSARVVIHHAVTVMMGVQAPAHNVEPKMIDKCYFYTRANARLLVQVVSLEKQAAKNANLAMQPAVAVLVLHHLSASLALRGCFCYVRLLASVWHVALKVSHNLCVPGMSCGGNKESSYHP